MALAEFECEENAQGPGCGRFDELVSRAGDGSLPASAPCPKCGTPSRRRISLPQSAGLAPWMRQDAEEANCRNREYLASPEARKLMKEDRLVPCGSSTGGS